MSIIQSTLIPFIIFSISLDLTSAQCSATKCTQCLVQAECEAIADNACRWDPISNEVCVSAACDTQCEDCSTIECLFSELDCTISAEDCVSVISASTYPPDPTPPPTTTGAPDTTTQEAYTTTKKAYTTKPNKPTKPIMTTEDYMTSDSGSDSDSDSSSDSESDSSSDSESDSESNSDSDSESNSDSDSDSQSYDSSSEKEMKTTDSNDKEMDSNDDEDADSRNKDESMNRDESVSSESGSGSDESNSESSDDGTNEMDERRTNDNDRTHRSNVYGVDADEYGENHDQMQDYGADSTKVASLIVVGVTCLFILIGLVIGGFCFYGKKAKSQRFGQAERVALSDYEEEEEALEETEITVMVQKS